jgi:hypothetical protein
MNGMWIFGDSFVSPLNANYDKDYHPDWTWTKQLATKLNLQTTIVAQPGISNQWISKKINEHEENMEEGDIVIIVTSEPNRTWLLEDFPEFSNIFVNNLEKWISKKQNKAVQSYVENFGIQHDFISQMHYDWFLHWCRSKLSSKVLLCLLPGFTNTDIHDTTDSNLALKDIDEQEFENLMDKPEFDKRMNHMSKENHTILADKVYKFLTENEKIDLSTDFLNSETIQPVR